MNLTDKQIDEYLSGIFSGKYDASDNLPAEVYEAISKNLMEGLEKGLGGIAFAERNPALMREFQENVYMFSGAKTYQQVREMGGFLAETSTYQEFKEKAMGVYEEYNKKWLRSEYNTAYAQGTTANQWEKIDQEKRMFPYIMYSAVMDANTSEECAGFNGLTLPVSDSFWDNYTPPNHFNCRCILEQVDHYSDEQVSTPAEKATAEEIGKAGVTDVFTMNPYKDKYIFNPDHPYFEVAPRDVAFAETNFGLPIPPPLVEVPATDLEFNYDYASMQKQGIADAMREMFAKNGQISVNPLINSTTLKVLRGQLETVQELMNEYAISPKNATGKIDLKFKSGKSVLGRVRRYIEGGNLAEINFGDKWASAIYHQFVEGATVLRQFSAVDLQNLYKSTTVHEFAHVLATESSARKLGEKAYQEFFVELKEVRKAYDAELLTLKNDNNLAGIYKIHLGHYAHTNLNEFMAEGFTEYKLKANPSKYAEKVGKLIDKYFKK